LASAKVIRSNKMVKTIAAITKNALRGAVAADVDVVVAEVIGGLRPNATSIVVVICRVTMAGG